MDQGYVKLWRKSLDSWVFGNPKLWMFWCWCLMKASHKQHKTCVGFQDIELLPGQFVFGRDQASAETGLSVRTVRTCVSKLKGEKLTIKTTNKFSIVSITNWDTYQGDNGTKRPAKRPASDQQATTNKNVKKEDIYANDLKYKKSVPVPNPFPILESMIEYAHKKGFKGDIESLTESFSIHHRKKGSKFIDWYAAWQTWLRNDLKWNPPPKETRKYTVAEMSKMSREEILERGLDK